ncbi:hypothetical protein [Microlunatus endophyticus]|uniref:hypothetical protein n=1 Tax=Microlunatus endophyticus TaxID=1716077 RepID=UPI001666D203|nr:hypothetical protein [Microlunatus endophyticus]
MEGNRGFVLAVEPTSSSPAGAERCYRTRQQATTFLVDRQQASGDEVFAQVAATAPILELLVRPTA